MPTGIQDPSGLSSFNNMTGIDDSSFSTPIGVETGMQDPSQVATGIVDSPQLDESARDEVVDYNTARDIAAQNERNQQSLSNLNLDTSGLGIDASGMTPPQLDEAARGQALADRNAVVDFGTLETQGSSPSNIDPLDRIDLSMDNLGGVLGTVDPKSLPKKGETQKLNLPFEKVMDLVDERIAIQKEIDNAPFNPLSLLPFGSLLGTSAGRRQKAITQALNQSGGSGILGSGVGGSTGLLGTGAVQFNPIYDGDGNFVGTQGVNKSGKTVSYSGNMQGNNGYFDGDGNNISKNIEGYQEEIGGQGAPGGMDIEYNPCQPGFELDPNTNTCVPIDVVGGGGGSSGPIDLNPIIRPVTPPVTSPGVPTPTPVSSPTLVTPKQFNMGGATSGSNLDGAIGRLLSSMS